MWFNRYHSFNFRDHFFKSRPEYSTIPNQTLHNVFVNTSDVSVMNVSCPLGI